MQVPVMAEMMANNEAPEVLFWVGCAGSFDQRAQKITKALATILNKVEIKYAILGKEEMCTGDPVRRAGNEFMFQMMAYQNIQILNGYGIKKIVTACPHCFNILKNEYPELGGSYEVIHHTTFLQQLINEGKIKMKEELRITHGSNFSKILPANERYMLSYAANRHRGARLKSLKNEIDDRLVNLIDNISLSVNDFFYGRYDIMCSSVGDLKEGKNFCILEYNGCGAGPTHIYGPGYTLFKAYRELAMHWEVLYRISMHNRRHGIKCWSFSEGLNFLKEAKKHYRIMKAADKNI